MTRESILVVDDEPGVRSMLEAILKDEGYGVAAVGTGEDGVSAATGRAFDALLLDVWLPGIDGIETLSRLKASGVDAEVVMISGHGTIETAVRATKLGAFDFVEKPLSLEKTLLVLRNALRQRRLEKRNRSLLDQLARDTEILGDSEAVRRVRRDAEAAAASEAPVLICGEPGSGRETVARHVHTSSRRADQAFVHVACGALVGSSGAAVLFGSEASPGRLALAERGSVFLEDVDSLPPDLQAAIADWLSRHPDVRVIATASADPVGLQPPLRGHIEVVRITTAPLRKRREDIGFLATRFLRDLAREYGRPEKRLSPDTLAALSRHEWPGNVRELRNVVERALLLAPADEIQLHDLPLELGGATLATEDLYAPFPTLADGLAAFERYFLRRALRENKGDVEAAARRAGISAAVLRGRID
jgi:two-component system, NtrC family, nitrogen regulation response regulator NtrX